MPHYDGGGAGDNKDRFYYMDVPNMWDMLQYHDSAPHQQALKGWRQSYELVLMHKTQVEKYKEKLITAWPPERSKASRAYVERLDHLIESLHETFEAAIANYTAYSTAIAAVDDAKRKLAAIQQEHSTNAAALAAYTAEMEARPRVYYGKAVPPPAPSSPVADGRQEQLRLQAAGLMTGLSAELATAQMSLTAPRPYDPTRIVNDSEQIGPGGFSPVLPPASSFSGSPATSPKGSKPSNSGNGIGKFPTEVDRGKTEQPTPGKTPSQGPILGGTKQPLTPPPTTGIPSTTPTTFTPSIISPDAPTFAPSQNSSSSTTPPRGPATPPTALGTVPPAPGTRGTSSLHGGVIGGTPPMGGPPSGRSGNSGMSTRGAQRINPIGGMIGQTAAVPPGRREMSRREDEQRSQHWDPDNPWETSIGIDPVLLPAEEQRINPGPTIGGR
jgi:hypothetical protein